MLRSVVLLLLIGLALCDLSAFAQQEGNYLMMGSPLRIRPNGLLFTSFYTYNPVNYDTQVDGIQTHYGGFHVDCDSAGMDLQYSTILTRGEFAPIVTQFPGAYLDTSGIGNTMAFPDRANPDILHALMPAKQSFPEYAMVQNIHLITYERDNFNVLRNIHLADSIAFGLHQVVRHQNRRDYWLVAMRSLQNNWYQPLVWLVRGMQLSGPVSQPPVYIHAYSPPVFQRMLQSPDESNLVVNTAKGAFTLFKFDRNTGLLYGRLPVNLQQIFYRPYAGDLLITTMNYSPLGSRLYAFTTDFRSYPFRNRMYQFDLTTWDSTAVARSFYNYQPGDTTYTDFMPAVNNRVYFMQFNPLTNGSALGHILQPDSIWGQAGHELISIYSNFNAPEAIGQLKFNVSRAHYNHPKRYRFSTTTGCLGDSTHFRMNEIRNMQTISWDMGDGVTYIGDSLYDPVHLYQRPGRYLVKATAQFCGQTVVMEDTVLVTGPPADYLKDTIICDGRAFALSAYQPQALSFAYQWRDGDTNAVRQVNAPGWWWVDVQGPCGSFRDSFYVSYDPKPVTGLPVDTFYCPGSTAQLRLQPGNYHWQWPDSSTNLYYNVSDQETEVVIQLENHCGKFTETVQVSRLEIPDFAPVDTLLCQSLPHIIDFSWDNYTRIRWDDGDSSRIRELRKAYDGSVTIDHPCGDSWVPVSINRESCDCSLFLPTAFSPNGDGLNDSYLPVFNCQPQFFELVVFDRWGKVVFQSKEATTGWDGRINGTPAESGFYAVRVSVLGIASREMRTEGTSVLLKR